MARIFSSGFRPKNDDSNPIIVEGRPTRTARLSSVVTLCDTLGREVCLHGERMNYRRGWGPHGANSAKVIAMWTL